MRLSSAIVILFSSNTGVAYGSNIRVGSAKREQERKLDTDPTDTKSSLLRQPSKPVPAREREGDASNRNLSIIDENSLEALNPPLTPNPFVKLLHDIPDPADQGSKDCSGVIIGPNHVLTAASCVYTQDNGWDVPSTVDGWLDGWLELVCYGCTKVTSATVYNKWVDDDVWKVGYDIAILTTKGRIGDHAGFATVNAMISDDFNSDKKNLRIYGIEGHNLYSTGECEDWYPYKITLAHKCDTVEDGMTGAPILWGHRFPWEERRMQEGFEAFDWEVVGVHTTGMNDYGWNSGVRLTDYHVQMINNVVGGDLALGVFGDGCTPLGADPGLGEVCNGALGKVWKAPVVTDIFP